MSSGVISCGFSMVKQGINIKQGPCPLPIPGFMVEQPFFPPYFTSIACHFAMASNYPVAGNNDGIGIFSIGSSHSPDGFRISKLFRQFQVTDCFTIGDLLKLLPYMLLEIRSIQRQGQVKSLQDSFEISIQLIKTGLDYRRRIRIIRFCYFLGKGYGLDGMIFFADPDDTNWRIIIKPGWVHPVKIKQD